MTHSTIPSFDHETGRGSGLLAHLITDHGRNPTMVRWMRDWERVELHRFLHEDDEGDET